MKFPMPAWFQAEDLVIADPLERMRFVIALARRNVAEGTGGPFGAAIFQRSSGRLLACGVNQVIDLHCSHAHAEMVAIANAQEALGSHDLGAHGGTGYELVTSSEPCAMCFGAIPWSGVKSVSCGAHAADAEAIGFDEGPKPENWAAALEQRGITVMTGCCRDEAVAVLQDYARRGAAIYNGSSRDL